MRFSRVRFSGISQIVYAIHATPFLQIRYEKVHRPTILVYKSLLVIAVLLGHFAKFVGWFCWKHPSFGRDLLTFDTVRGGLLESATVQLDLLRFGAVQG